MELLPIIVLVISNTAYNLFAKLVPAGVNVYVSLVCTYAVSLVTTLVFILLTGQGGAMITQLRLVPWVSYVLGISIVGVEFGYIMAYRSGRPINSTALYVTIVISLVLIPIGVVVWHEPLSFKKIAGIVLGIISVILMS